MSRRLVICRRVARHALGQARRTAGAGGAGHASRLCDHPGPRRAHGTSSIKCWATFAPSALGTKSSRSSATRACPWKRFSLRPKWSSDPHIQARETIQTVRQRSGAELKMEGPPAKLSRTPVRDSPRGAATWHGHRRSARGSRVSMNRAGASFDSEASSSHFGSRTSSFTLRGRKYVPSRLVVHHSRPSQALAFLQIRQNVGIRDGIGDEPGPGLLEPAK